MPEKIIVQADKLLCLKFESDQTQTVFGIILKRLALQNISSSASPNFICVLGEDTSAKLSRGNASPVTKIAIRTKENTDLDTF